ncbi:response regulator transcription factor [Algoriphagus aestuariicola]|uniref:Response regulator transcription factor n=1 Tax=Algoriphagus aestuariicola TaxID=1852016 RepID=A0ABS3BMV9_9BACT|nr:LytTR family DNA-binding domain-containing protein [Algoriphagus aestuariicola]MBN7800164.1 response regulator transcription factor [Algoriphagus aestuariicola]
MAYKTIVIEDEKHAQENLISLLKQYPEFELVGLADSVDSAEKLVEQTSPDLAICDVMLKDGTSFDWLGRRSKIDFALIFSTSFEEYAVRAFRMAAVDYLVKPIDPMAFAEALERFKSKKGTGVEHIQQLLSNLSRNSERPKVALPSFTGYTFVHVADIVRCESDNTYTTFFLKDKRQIIVSRTLKDCEDMLEGYRFYRIHNSHLINLDYLAEYIKGEGGQVKLIDGTVLDVSRRRKEGFLSACR